MQVQPNRAATTLQQGSIFTLNNLQILKEGNPAQLFGEGSFYPEVKYDPTDLGLVYSQSCDVYCNNDESRQPKVPYVNIGVLESFGKYFKSNAFKYDFKIDISNYFFEMDISSEGDKRTYRFFNSATLENKFVKVFQQTIQNNHSYLFFINLSENETGEDLYVTNLLKIFPVKIEHYESILKCVTYELKAEFANKMGWKIASLYGQIGTTDYKEAQVTTICKTLSKKFATALSENHSTALFVSEELFNEAKVAGNKKMAEKLDFLQKNFK